MCIRFVGISNFISCEALSLFHLSCDLPSADEPFMRLSIADLKVRLCWWWCW
jgi:hypothetical protein